jgi:Fe-S-cluster-containing dehydrogenase component/anaerobic selenocysteine-containing dehydrogenase
MDDSRDVLNGKEPNYWRSLRELHDPGSVSEARAHEFMAGVTDRFDMSDLSTLSRKQFLALLTASAAFAAAGCTNYRDKGEIVPYTRKPEEIVPGVANSYASTCSGCSQGCGILIKTREGRPIKIDGNPDHPINKGKICAKGQASILDLYDPNRLRTPATGASSGRMGNVTWRQADAEIRKQLDACTSSGKQIAIITNGLPSPTSGALFADFVSKYPTTRVYSYEVFSDENRRRAWRACYDTAEIPAIAWEKARVVVALESDFLGIEGSSIETIRRFTDARDVMKSARFNRLYCVEGAMTLTGANADYRLRLRPDAQLEFVLSLINAVVTELGPLTPARAPSSTWQHSSLSAITEQYGLSRDHLDRLVKDLVENRGAAIVHAGDGLSVPVHTAVNYLNEVLGNTALYETRHAHSEVRTSTPDEFLALVTAMKSGRVGLIIHFGSNPVYHLPRLLGFADALKSVPLSTSLVQADDETSAFCTYVLPANHPLESWGDFEVRSGVLSLQQPVIAPLYDTRQKEAVLLTWMSADGVYSETVYHEYLKARWQREVYPRFSPRVDFPSFWFSALHDGVITTPADVAKERTFHPAVMESIDTAAGTSGIAVALRPSYYIGDGSFANNGWLQELPHPVSKVVWDNYAAISETTANRLGLVNADLVEVVLPHGKQTFPVFVQPGHADNCVSIELGYGRWNAGPVGTGVGVDATMLLTKEGLAGRRVYSDARVTKTAGRHEIVSTQEHHALDDPQLNDLHIKREIIREGTLRQYEKEPNFVHEKKVELSNIAREVEYKGVKWAMAIDLNKCIGCNACVAGCNVENNIPVVGKEQVKNGRAMHWVRIDRYYAGTAQDPRLSSQPMLCQHCDNAPCENVCPVVATNHSPDGLNQMVYNRCVGTKYCSNNCPYKVRRFNFFNWRDDFADGYYEQEPVNLVHNPEVTVRSRGVMEKCTFCVQRILEARQHAIEQRKPFKGSDVKTACQQACPATAIIFGDMNDPESEVSKYRKHNLGYHVLEETNARPNVTYMAKLRNIDAEKIA